MLVVGMVMLAAAALGATINLALSAEPRTWKQWMWNAAAGFGAAALVPLFLRTVSSDLLRKVLTSTDSLEDWLVFFGFCVLAAASARRFIESLSHRVLEEARQARQEAAEAKQEVVAASTEAKQASAAALAVRDSLDYGLRDQTELRNTDATFPEIVPGAVDDDPWAGQFGGASTNAGYALEAELRPLLDRPDWNTVTLTVRSTLPDRPLTGAVQFYLHPSFGPGKPTVLAHGGRAALSLISWGAFTVGALCEAGGVRLELDLARHQDAREPWRSR